MYIQKENIDWIVKFSPYFCQGNRTLAVCTKLDLMDHGTDALDILFGRGKGKDSIYHQILKFVIQVPFFVKFESF